MFELHTVTRTLMEKNLWGRNIDYMPPPCCRTSSASLQQFIPTRVERVGTLWKQVNSVDQTLENVALGKSQQPLHINEHAELHPAAARKNGHV